MNLATVVASALLSFQPFASDADRVADAIVAQTGDNTDSAAFMAATALRESSLRQDVGSCAVEGIGGLGYFGLSEQWGRRRACGSPAQQASVAWVALGLMGWGTGEPGHTIRKWLGATRATSEEKRRLGVYWILRERLRCRCSI